jgi:hypothetical protein
MQVADDRGTAAAVLLRGMGARVRRVQGDEGVHELGCDEGGEAVLRWG